MYSSNLKLYADYRHGSIQRRYTVIWNIQNFYCSEVLDEMDLPSKTFDLKIRPDMELIGELSLIGNKCINRCFQMILLSTSQHWRIYFDVFIQTRPIRCTYSLSNLRSHNSISLNKSQCLLSEGDNTIECTLYFLDDITHIEIINRCHGFSELFGNNKFADVTLIVAGHEYHAHKCVLATRSKVFYAMFQHQMEEAKSNKVFIYDIDADVFEEMLRFMYTGKVLNFNEVASGLLAAADIYDLPLLRRACANKLRNKISVKTAADTLILADLYGQQNLKEHAIYFVEINYKAVKKTKGWRRIIKQYSHLMTEIVFPIKE